MRHRQARLRDNANSQGCDTTPPQRCHMSTGEIIVQQGLHNDQEVFLFWMTLAKRAWEMSALEGMDKQQLVHLHNLVG